MLVLPEMPSLVELPSSVVSEYAEGRQVRRDHRRRNVDDSIVVMVKVLILRQVRELLHQRLVELLLLPLEGRGLMIGRTCHVTRMRELFGI